MGHDGENHDDSKDGEENLGGREVSQEEEEAKGEEK